MKKRIYADLRQIASELAALRIDVERLENEVHLLRCERMDGLLGDMRRSAREMLRLSRGL